ncbi:Hypothetical protein ACI5QL_01468 [Bacillus velezensis]
MKIFNFESEVLIRSVIDIFRRTLMKFKKELFQMLKRRFRNLAKK